MTKVGWVGVRVEEPAKGFIRGEKGEVSLSGSKKLRFDGRA